MHTVQVTNSMSEDGRGKAEHYQKITNKSDLQEESMIKIRPNGKQIVLSMVEGKIYAIDNVCSHKQVH